MIIGLGSDLCDITRVEKTLERFGERFVTRVFTDLERRKAEGRAKPAASEHLAPGMRGPPMWHACAAPAPMPPARA